MAPYRVYSYGRAEPESSGSDVDIEVTHTSSLWALPIELLVWVFIILDARRELQPRHLAVCKHLYNALIPLLYRLPILKATNFFAFVDTVSRRRHLGRYIQELNLSSVVQLGKNAFVAKLLKRSASSLRVFVAPFTSFGFGPLLALKNCLELRILDLALVLEMFDLGELFRSISRLHNLTHLSFPRSSIEISDVESIEWPLRLSHLHISGGISDEFLIRSVLPPTITHLEFSNCPQIKDEGVHDALVKVGRHLSVFKVQYPMPGLSGGALDEVFSYAPNLTVLEVSVEYVLGNFFDEDNLILEDCRPLHTLFIRSSGLLGTSTKLDPADLAIALDDGRLPSLKWCVTLAQLGWSQNSEYVTYIAMELEEREGGLHMSY